MLGKTSHRTAGGSKTVFYTTVAGVEEVRSGYLLKSPPPSRLKSLKSWKRRFFVLFKTKWNTHLLKYYRNEDEREKAQGVIDLFKISLLYLSPDKHSKWDWIHQTFKCPPDCVLYIRADNRDYYLISEKVEVDGWFNDIYKALRNLSGTQGFLLSESHGRSRSSSEPALVPSDRAQALLRVDQRPRSTQVDDSNPSSYYATPRSVLEIITQENEDDDEEEAEEETSFYTRMDRVVEMPKDEGLYENFPVKQKNSKERRNLPPVPIKTEGPKMQKEQVNHDRLGDWIKGEITEGTLDLECLYVSSDDFQGMEKISASQKMAHANVGPTFSAQNQTNRNARHIDTEIEVDVSDLRRQLKVEDVDGKPCIMEWNTHSRSSCLFRRGDQILAMNDLETESAAEVQKYLCKLLGKKVKLTLRRLPGAQADQPSCSSCK